MRGFASVLPPLFALVLAPLLFGLINRTKAFVAGRRGPPLLQPYFDILKCLRRGAVYGEATSWIFRLGPAANLAALLAAILIVPFGGMPSPLSFPGDLIVLAGLLALGRFATVLAALDTGSSFEGMGASREVHFAALTEPAFLLALAVLARVTGGVFPAPLFYAVKLVGLVAPPPAFVPVAATVLILPPVEKNPIPVAGPPTPLPMTLIHQVM